MTLTAERIDKFLWTVRLFKSRSEATEACRKGRVLMNGLPVKPAHMISSGATFMVRKPPVTYTYQVRGLPPGRVAAKLVAEYILNITPEEEMNRINPNSKMFFSYRPRGTGRPTKRERRDIENFLE
jgi:ribosome-associated heat shock protein Hsp15